MQLFKTSTDHKNAFTFST